MMRRRLVVVMWLVLILTSAQGLADPPAEVGDDEWALKIVVFDVGQADAILLLTPNGRAALVDLGKTKAHGDLIADYLSDPNATGLGVIDKLWYLFVTHYDLDHIGGARSLRHRMPVRRAYDQGRSKKRDPTNPASAYYAYVNYVGDPDGDGIHDHDEASNVRWKAKYGRKYRLSDDVELRILSVRGDTRGSQHDLDLDPSQKKIDENPGSIIMLVRLNDFECLMTGDATSDDWKAEPDTEETLINAGAIPDGHDIDVLKVSHHGSDTSSGKQFVTSTRPEVAIISSDLTSDRLPKLTTLKVLEKNRAMTLVTGSATDANGVYHQSKHSYDDGHTPDPTKVFDDQGTITILVDSEGQRYTVINGDGSRKLTFSAVDSQN